MKTILLVIALVAKADAPKADLPMVAAASAAAAAVTVVGEIAPASAAVLDVAVVGEVAPMTAAVCAETVVGEVAPMSAAVPSAGGVLPSAASAAGCALVDLFRGDAGFLSGPWSAARRLGSARRRGDADAALRLSATLDALLAEALAVGELP